MRSIVFLDNYWCEVALLKSGMRNSELEIYKKAEALMRRDAFAL